MAEPCFKMKNSNPPVCGVHNVPLIEHQSSGDFVLSRFGGLRFLCLPSERICGPRFSTCKRGLQTER
jgi:hypothetical protein